MTGGLYKAGKWFVIVKVGTTYYTFAIVKPKGFHWGGVYMKPWTSRYRIGPFEVEMTDYPNL